MISGNGNGWHYRIHVSAWVAIALNVLLILVVCFFVGPRIDECIHETAKNRDAIEANRQQLAEQGTELRAYRKELQENLALVARLNKVIDDAVRKAEKAKPKKE